jgi:uncharacterized protein YegP (UPF0339 family)
MTEFSRRVDVHIVKDEPLPREALGQKIGATFGELTEDIYRKYVEEHQAYRWRAIAANNEIVAHGESYHNLADCINAVELLMGDNTTAYRVAVFGEDLSETLLRYGATDRASRA